MNPFLQKPAHQLSESDFRHAPVWRFMESEEASSTNADESFVCAHEAGPMLGEYASYLVSATYTLKNGSLLPGFVELAVLGKMVECTPGAVFAKGKTVESLGKDTALRLQRILKLEGAQPVAWQLDVCVGGEREPRRSTIARPGLLQVLMLLFKLGRLHRAR